METCPICGLPIDGDDVETCECPPRDRERV